MVEDHRERLEKNLKERIKTDEKNKEREEKHINDWFTKDAGGDPGAFHPLPKKLPEEDKTLMDAAWTFLQKTYREKTTAALRDYLLFSYNKARTTQGLFHALQELCRLNVTPDKGREVVEKAVYALKPELRRAVEPQTLTWGEDDLMLAKLEETCRQIEEALHARELGGAPVNIVKEGLTGKLGGLSFSEPATSSQRRGNKGEPARESKRQSKGERRRKKKEKQAFAAGPPATPSSGGEFTGDCFNCGKKGHRRSDCREKPKEGSAPKPAGNPKGKPRNALYAAPAAQPTDEDSEDDERAQWEQFMAWSASGRGPPAHLRALAVVSDEGPQLRPSMEAQRDTNPAARARGEAERLAARAKEDCLRKGGPPPPFKPKGERPPPEPETAGEEEPEEEAPARRRRAAREEEPLPTREVRLPPAFQEYAPTDSRYQGLEGMDPMGVREEQLEDSRVGPIPGETVKRRGPANETPVPVYFADEDAGGEDIGEEDSGGSWPTKEDI